MTATPALPGSDIDIMRDVYMTNTQRAAYERILAASLPVSGADALRQAAMDLYMAGRWDCAAVQPSEAARKWQALRDALGLEVGTATKAGIAASPSGVGGGES